MVKFLFPRGRLYVCHYIYKYARPDNQNHAHSHCVRTLTLIPDIAATEETKKLKVNEKETAHKGLSKINIRYSYQQELLYFRGT